MNKIVALVLLGIGVGSAALATNVPEIDPASGASALALLAGAIVVTAALIVEVKYQPPFWLHAVLWLPLILATTLLPLRSMKSLLIALQFHHKAAPGQLIDRDPK